MQIDIEKARAHLSRDKVLKQIIDRHPIPEWNPAENLLESLVESIISQQLSVKASDTIYRRFLELFNNKFPTTEEILTQEDETLRARGLSYQKIGYIKGIAKRITEENLDLSRLHTLSDEEAIEELIKFKGVGKWTAEMLLMFDLARPDIFSLGDLGLRTAVAKLYQVDRDDHEKILTITTPWSPYRSVASRYLWISLDNTPK